MWTGIKAEAVRRLVTTCNHRLEQDGQLREVTQTQTVVIEVPRKAGGKTLIEMERSPMVADGERVKPADPGWLARGMWVTEIKVDRRGQVTTKGSFGLPLKPEGVSRGVVKARPLHNVGTLTLWGLDTALNSAQARVVSAAEFEQLRRREVGEEY